METNRVTALSVSYDLSGRNRQADYRTLWRALEKLGGERESCSTWTLSTDKAADEVCSLLSTVIQPDDKLSVATISGPVWVAA